MLSGSVAQEPPYFEGELTFKTYVSRSTSPGDRQRETQDGLSKYLYKDAYYKGITRLKDTLVYLYNGNLARCILYTSGDHRSYCMDYSKKDTDRPKRIRLLKETKHINGYKCIGVEVKYKDRVTRSYYHTALKLDPAVYQTHKAYGYDRIMKMALGGILVRSENVYPTYTLYADLINIFPRKIDDAEFAPEAFEHCR
jgi:hypothetical protein